MAPPKRKSAKATPQLRSRTTRSRGKALADPAENTQSLNEQLRALGLYAAPTLGDGNCLFRALSDQLYGTPSYHLKLRQDVCNWIESHKQRYEPFVEDERGLDVHLQCMRQQGTYGGHLELSAFAHMTKRNVKVIQPGLVYVIEWNAGGDVTPEHSPSPAPSRHASPAPSAQTATDSEKTLTRRERKRFERQLAAARPPTPPSNDSNGNSTPTVYVAYHDWEHFSSIRNLRGPHAGLPNVQETPIDDTETTPPPAVSPVKKKPSSRVVSTSKPSTKVKIKRPSKPSVPERPLTPSQVPLPLSRSVSPPPEPSTSLLPLSYPMPTTPPSPSRIYRSPKRTFDESSASSESSQSLAKRHKGVAGAIEEEMSAVDTRSPLSLAPEEGEGDMDTPPLTLSAPGSPSSMSSLSSISSPEPTPPPSPKLTQRQLKKLGLPKPRHGSPAQSRRSAGKIVIPGGRMKRAGTASDASADTKVEEWQKNGTGRVDVRGFRELKI